MYLNTHEWFKSCKIFLEYQTYCVKAAMLTIHEMLFHNTNFIKQSPEPELMYKALEAAYKPPLSYSTPKTPEPPLPKYSYVKVKVPVEKEEKKKEKTEKKSDDKFYVHGAGLPVVYETLGTVVHHGVASFGEFSPHIQYDYIGPTVHKIVRSPIVVMANRMHYKID